MNTKHVSIVSAAAVAIVGIITFGITSSSQTTPTTTTTTTKPKTTVPKTSIVINYGKDCKMKTLTEFDRLYGEYSDARKNQKKDIPTREEYVDQQQKLTTVRSYVRSLDIPFISEEQTNFVDTAFAYYSSFQDYWESDKRDLTVNEWSVLLYDAYRDFRQALIETCALR